MSERAATVREQLDAWRELNADRVDPVRFHCMDTLERRAAGREGEVRRLLDERLAALAAAYAAEVERAAAKAAPAETASATSPLRALADLLNDRAASRGTGRYPALPVLDEFRQLWSRLRTESQLQQSLEQVPANAGPLNSGTLVHRSIALMRDVSPGYLQHFVAYADALSWMEQLGPVAPLAADAPRAPASGRKRAGKPRARQD